MRILGEVRKDTPTCCAVPTRLGFMRRPPACAPPTWYELTSQAFAVFLPVKSVGVMGPMTCINPHFQTVKMTGIVWGVLISEPFTVLMR